MAFVQCGGAAAALEGTTLVLPSVAVGNVAQLAADLLINTLEARRIGLFDSASVLAVSGASGFDHGAAGQRAAPVEVYQTADARWTLVQQRAPPLPGRHGAFARELLAFIQAARFARVVLLASSDAALRPDALIHGAQIRSLTVNWPGDGELAARLRALALDPLRAPRGAQDPEPLKQLHAAGVAKRLLALCGPAGVPVVALVALASEGDNVPDAVRLANAANALLEIAPADVRWRPPRSWQWLAGPGGPRPELY
ncbi:hypothetical protein H4R18_003722 [Coemansia javaensis]|uniref:Proteasome assembly chaperone 2 n=1 Tax=Coemansia javaensis TaxID=2761396 RepID=A0A9W8HB52_9FUNG|nr:hypothetical protein H4R18_003722 [Coemansia javaensis]